MSVQKYIISVVALLFFGACSSLVTAQHPFVETVDQNSSDSIAVFALKNYTDTPQAGMRASNIIGGVLNAQGYEILDYVAKDLETLDAKIDMARLHGAKYLLVGGVSEWRYKTGIDGEPAVSLTCKLISTSSAEIVWSATGSDNSWGNASVGTTAHALIESMFD